MALIRCPLRSAWMSYGYATRRGTYGIITYLRGTRATVAVGGQRQVPLQRHGLRVGPVRRAPLDPPPRLVQLVEYALVVVHEQRQRQHGRQRHHGHGEHDGQLERVLGEHQRAHPDGAVEDGLLVEPERDGQEHRQRDHPREHRQHGRPLRRQPRPVRRHHDAPVSVHADQRQRPQQHEAAHELHAAGRVKQNKQPNEIIIDISE